MVSNMARVNTFLPTVLENKEFGIMVRDNNGSQVQIRKTSLEASSITKFD